MTTIPVVRRWRTSREMRGHRENNEHVCTHQSHDEREQSNFLQNQHNRKQIIAKNK